MLQMMNRHNRISLHICLVSHATSPKLHAYSRGGPYPPSCLFDLHKHVYHRPIGRCDVREPWLAGKVLLPTCFLGPLLCGLHCISGPQRCFGMVYLWFLLCQCIQRPQWQHIDEVGQSWINMCRVHIMLTLDMCSGPFGVTLGRVYNQMLVDLLWQCLGCSHFCIPFFCKRSAVRLEQNVCDWWWIQVGM